LAIFDIGEKGMLILKKKAACCLLLSFLILISGCYDSEDIDRRVIVNPIGIDSRPNGKMLATFRMHIISPTTADSSAKNTGSKSFIIHSSLASGVFQALNNIQVQDDHTTFIGQCRAVIFGEGFAKTGLKPGLDFFSRMPTFPPTAYIVIGRPTAEAIQNINWPETEMHDQNIRWFFSNRPNQKYGVKKWSLFRDIFDPLQDPLIPIVTPWDNNQTMKLIGLAIFSEDRMVGELNLTEAALLQLLINTGKENRITIPLNQNNQASFHSITGRKKVKVYYLNDQPLYKITLRVNAFLGELTGSGSPITEKELAMIRKRTESYLEKTLIKILKKLQVMKSDPLGLGNYFRAKQSKHFSIKKWPLHYQQAQFRVDVKVFIERLGVLK
jgi:Ger(x)C family germination protein